MSVRVKLPRTVTGEELSSAIEEAGKKIAWLTERTREIYYEPGSVKARELNSTLTIIKPGTKRLEASLSLWDILRGKPKNVSNRTTPSLTRFKIELPAEQRFDSIEFSTEVEVKIWNPLGPPCAASVGVSTADPRFVKEIQPGFEKFLGNLFEILEQNTASA